MILVIAILLLPFSNAHIHLSQAHDDDNHHYHAAEVHTFHDVQAHDNIAPDLGHASDTAQVDLDDGSWRLSPTKIFKVLALLAVTLFLPLYIASRTKRIVPQAEVYVNRFLFFHRQVRGPPSSL
jgi:hypothetical protein